MERLSREEYKVKFLTRCKTEGKRGMVPVSRPTKNKLKQLCSAVDGPRLPIGNLLEKIIDEHCTIHSGTIKELYKEDIPIY